MVAPPTKGSSIWIAERSYARALIKAGGVIPVGLVDRRGPSAGFPLPSNKKKKKGFLVPPWRVPNIFFNPPPPPGFPPKIWDNPAQKENLKNKLQPSVPAAV